jgi:hypothetical protein
LEEYLIVDKRRVRRIEESLLIQEEPKSEWIVRHRRGFLSHSYWTTSKPWEEARDGPNVTCWEIEIVREQEDDLDDPRDLAVMEAMKLGSELSAEMIDRIRKMAEGEAPVSCVEVKDPELGNFVACSKREWKPILDEESCNGCEPVRLILEVRTAEDKARRIKEWHLDESDLAANRKIWTSI